MLSGDSPNSTHEYSWENFYFFNYTNILAPRTVSHKLLDFVSTGVSAPKKMDCNQSGHVLT